MNARLFRTADDWGATVARLALAIVIFPHGAQKALGWFGGGGPASAIQGFSTMGIPTILGVLAIIAEFAGSIGLALGCLTRIAAFGILCNMVVAGTLVSSRNGFWMNWYGKQQGEGFEFHILAAGLALSAVIRGAGAFSIDRLIAARLQAPAAGAPQ